MATDILTSMCLEEDKHSTRRSNVEAPVVSQPAYSPGYLCCILVPWRQHSREELVVLFMSLQWRQHDNKTSMHTDRASLRVYANNVSMMWLLRCNHSLRKC